MSAPSILLQARQIEARVAQLAKDIDKHYNGEEFVLLVVLKGAVIFAADLMRQLRTPFQLEFAQSRSYGDSASPEHAPSILVPALEKVSDKHVLVVDDILDTGATYLALKDALLEREALSVRGCFLLDKPARRDPRIKPDFFGFQIQDVFVVGYGLDHAERFRNLPHIAQLPDDPA
jgi:hypoxanthine phosphoribosyltransferase